MATQVPENRAESVFDDFKPAYDQGQALAEANKAADKLVEKARKERDTLIAKATSEVRSRVR